MIPWWAWLAGIVALTAGFVVGVRYRPFTRLRKALKR